MLNNHPPRYSICKVMFIKQSEFVNKCFIIFVEKLINFDNFSVKDS